MTEPQNPYSPPSAQGPTLDQIFMDEMPQIASRRARFITLIVDQMALFVIGSMVGVVIIVVGGEAGIDWFKRTPDFLIGIPVMLAYYFIFELTTSRTLGKLLTGTMVVDEYGQPATPGQIAGRTFCRLIPFDVFTFLGKPSRGWHDSIPNTYVIKARR